MADPESHLSDKEMAELCALADGTLPAERRQAVEAWVAGSPDLQNIVDRQRRSLVAIRATASEPVPASLRTAVQAQVGERRQGRSRRLIPRLAFGGAAAAAAAVALVVVLSGGAAEPTAAEAADFAARPPSGPAPARLEGSRTELAADVEGVEFPDFRRAYGWRPAGIHEGTIAGRDATVVYYRKGLRQVAYVIVSGSGLPRPSDGTEHVRRGIKYLTFQADVGPALTWERVGHTCVLIGTASEEELLALASWAGEGALRY